MKSQPKSPLDSSPLERGVGRDGNCLEGSGSKPELFPLESKQEEAGREGRNKKKGENGGVEGEKTT